MKLSNRNRRDLMLAGLGGLSIQLDMNSAHAQDAAKVMPKSYKIAFENDKLRVLEFSGRPGMGVCGEGVHSHPEHLTVVLSDWKGMATLENGTKVPRDKKIGDVFWSDAEVHKVENTGKSNSRVLIIELKTSIKVNA